MPTEESPYIINIQLQVDNEAIHYKISDNKGVSIDPVPLIYENGKSQLPKFQTDLAQFLQDPTIIKHFNAYQTANPAPAAKPKFFSNMFNFNRTSNSVPPPPPSQPKAGGKKTKSNRSYNANKTLKNKK